MTGRFAILALLMSLASHAFGSQALILIRHDAVSRVISPESYNHDLWVRWPRATNKQATNLLLSLTTGLDWTAPPADLAFRKEGAAYTSLNVDHLRHRGYFSARRAGLRGYEVVSFSDPSGYVAAQSLFLGLGSSGVVRPVPLGSFIPEEGLGVYTARSWDDAALLASRMSGRAILVEYPPDPGQVVSAAWLLGRGWPKGSPSEAKNAVPGLVPASQILSLLRSPLSYRWVERAPAQSNSPQQWMRTVTETRPLHVAGLFLATLLVAAMAAVGISGQLPSRAIRMALAATFLGIPAFLWGGNLARYVGLGPWNLLPLVAGAGLAAILGPLHLWLRVVWPKTHPLFPLFVLIIPALLIAEPDWTVFSGVFGSRTESFSPAAWGALASAMVGAVSCGMPGGFWPRLLAGTMLLGVLILSMLHVSWNRGPALLNLLPVLCLVAGSGAMRWYHLPLFVLAPFLYQGWNLHFSWSATGLLRSYEERQSLNVAEHARFLLSSIWLCTLVGLGGLVAWGGPFLRHELRRTLLVRPTCRAFLWAALATACMGLREPLLLHSAVVIGFAGLLVLLFDAAGAF